MSSWLLVRVDGRDVALPVAMVERVVDVPPPLAVPARLPGLRGVVPVEGRLAPVLQLGVALHPGTRERAPGGIGVAVAVGGRRVVLEVDEVLDVIACPEEALPARWHSAWAASAVRGAAGLVPVLDDAWLAGLLGEAAAAT